MDWQTIGQYAIKIAIGIVCALVSGLASWLLVKVKTLIATKVKNAKAQQLLNAALDAVAAATKATQQTFVDNIKNTDQWNEQTKRAALESAISTAKAQMSSQVQKYIQEQCGGDVDAWIKTHVEALLHDIKSK